MLKLQEMKQEPLNEKKQKRNFNCNFIFQEKNFVFILYLLVNFFKGSGEKYTLNEAQCHEKRREPLGNSKLRLPKVFWA